MIRTERLNTQEHFDELEKVRSDAFKNGYIKPSNLYLEKIKNNEVLLYGLYYKDELCAGCYVSIVMDSIFIDDLFVKSKYQNSGLKLGRVLLRYVNNDADYINSVMKTNIDKSMLIYYDEKSKEIYIKEDYIEDKELFHVMEKKLKKDK